MVIAHTVCGMSPHMQELSAFKSMTLLSSPGPRGMYFMGSGDDMVSTRMVSVASFDSWTFFLDPFKWVSVLFSLLDESSASQ